MIIEANSNFYVNFSPVNEYGELWENYKSEEQMNKLIKGIENVKCLKQNYKLNDVGIQVL